MSKSDSNPLNIDVISIQSQVVYGMVGNNAVVPVLQAHGLNVCIVPTVYLSNSPLYNSLHGGVIPEDWFTGYLQAIEDRGVLNKCRSILLGYLGSSAQADILSTWLAKVQQQHQHITIQIDPVLGDIDCGFYVDQSLNQAYREKLRYLAHGMTPNHFELECLCGEKLQSLEQTIAGARSLLSEQTQWIITTSAAPETWQEGQMQILIVQKDGYEVQSHAYYKTSAQGTGDTFASTLAAQMLKGKSLSEATRLASEQVVRTILRTNAEDSNELQLIATLQQ